MAAKLTRPLAVSACGFALASPGLAETASRPDRTSLASMRLTVDFSRFRMAHNSAAVSAPRAPISTSVCTAEAERSVFAKVAFRNPSSRTRRREASRIGSIARAVGSAVMALPEYSCNVQLYSRFDRPGKAVIK